MASGIGKHKLLSMGPTEPWSVREKLCLATSVMKSGDQNWVSVSRAIKPFAEPGRPPDWFSQKHCASQYSELLETTETPKRKRGEKGEVVETVEDLIVRRLTAERIDELKRLIKDTQEKHRKLKTEAELIQAGHLDSKLEDLWGEIVQKKKQEQDEADVKRKATDTAYLARQAVKNTPKRVPSVTVRSPPGCGSPSLEFCQGDTPQNTPEDPSTSVTAPGAAGFMPLTEACGLGGAEAGLGTLLDESPQKKLLGQKATPPPSPLLSELLKKGNLLPTSPRLVGEGDLPGNMTIAHDLQLTGSVLPGCLATGAPTLSRLLEAGPQFSAPLGSLASSTDSSSVLLTAAAPPTMDSPASLHTGGNEVGASQPGPGEGTEEDLVTVSYMAEELDQETVGDIIAIIEDKGDENTEALDAAAVEAALSLCEETGYALSGRLEPGPFKPPESDPSGAPHSSSHLSSLAGSQEVKREALELRSGSSACDSQDNCPSGYPRPLGISGLPPSSSSSSCSSMMLEHSQAIGGRLQPGAMGGADGEGSPVSPHATIKCESEEWTQQGADTPHADSEDGPMTRRHSKDVKEEEGVSDGEEGSASETKEGLDGDGGDEEGDGAEAYLSEAEGETELEPPASESEDGYSLHTASSSLQLHTTADSIPSSPASSQFSMCSEDQEARQAQKIWKKAIMLVWRAAANHRYANVFLQPVTDDIAPGYHSIVHRPMDLSSIKKNIETGLIRNTAEFQRDIMLMFQNAVMYNSCDHDVFHMALEMQRDVLEQVQQFLATQLIMQTSESGISAKSLRGRESTRKQDPSDKDSVPMASPAFLLSLFDGGTRGRRCAIEADLKMKK
ncbi:bromodomain-containing protein 8-like [Coregonus clupeaformis]|uniref:bromodomain-containing protein 8-like n=1 Tax=Coregonus clupeaformis TaxID=59861 RepID=UPI001E1C45FF|nr:bromodomain-containing protein 8-like [Coregonus clupeaformis]